jgi:WD40 repeat protein
MKDTLLTTLGKPRPNVDPRGRRARWSVALATFWCLSVWPIGITYAQLAVRDPTQPIPVVNAGGHTAPVRSLVFVPPDGSMLLSGGMDKVVNVWDLRPPRPGLVRTLRPRIWRGYAGVIYAMALSPAPEADGHGVLAVAGYGVDGTRGEINLFRFPGSNSRPTGDIIARLPSGGADEAQPRGHMNTVTCLAFLPGAKTLASGSNDTTVRLWDVANRSTFAVLRGHRAAVNAIAVAAGGHRLVSGAADGEVILWDLDRRVEIARARPNPARHPDGAQSAAINTHMLAVSPDERWVVVGRENGDLIRYDAATLANETLLNPRPPDANGSVECLAISPDGTKLVTSIVAFALVNVGERPRVECDVELRSMPDGRVIERLGRNSNLTYACAFSPDGRRVAFAGGDDQAITIKDLSDPNRATVVLAGQGSSVWDVGFAEDGRSVGIARSRPDLADPPRTYEDFDLSGRRAAPFASTDLRRGLTTWEGWRVRPLNPYRLDVLNAQGQGYRIDLDPQFDRRWWSYSFLPPGPAHPRPVVAIGCEAGVAVYSLDTGKRTRLYAGHSGPVYSLAPSPDGRWLLTGSSDQTARFWTLAGCDTLAPLGATFERLPNGRAKVATVARRGFAEAMGLSSGDEFATFFIDEAAKTPNDLAELDAVLPDHKITFDVIRAGAVERLQTTKRDGPALTLFLGRDREWVLWAPSGYYETSPIGDRKYLGWHRNRLNPLEPTDYFAFDNYERDLRQPDALLRFLQSADRDDLRPAVVAAAPPAPARAPEQVVSEDRLPAVQVVAPARPAFDPLAVPGAGIAVRVQAARDAEDQAAAPGLIQRLRVYVDSGKEADLAVNPPAARVDQVVNLNLNPGRHKVSVVAVNNRGKERVESFELVAQEPPRPAPPVQPSLEVPRLVVLSVGADKFAAGDAALPPIPFASQDARDLGGFLAAPNGSRRYQNVDTQLIGGRDATAGRIRDALKGLDERCQKGDLGQGDSVFVILESHFLGFERGAGLVGVDASADSPEGPTVPAEEVSDALGKLADYGCRVMVLVDAVHERRPASQRTNRPVNEWVRALYRKNVIAFVASIHGPSRRYLPGAHGVFAQAVLDSLNARGQARLAGAPQASPSLFDFQDVVARNVLALTDRQQYARCYIPETIPSRAPVFDPPARRQTRELRASRD